MLNSKKSAIILLAAITFSFSVPAYAATADDIAAASGGMLHVTADGGLESTPISSGSLSSDKVITTIIEPAVSTGTRFCDSGELLRVDYRDSSSGRIYSINSTDIAKLEGRIAYVNDWLKANMPTIIPSGTDRETAIRTAFNYIIDNYPYDDYLTSYEQKADAQGAYYVIANGKGICASYSKLFRAMLEYLPFNTSGVVDYNEPNPTHIIVAIVNDADHTHEWDAIQDPDGTWYYYDITHTAADCSTGNIMITGDGQIIDISQYHLSATQLVGHVGHGREDEWIFEY